jgi:hypothetical protein
MSGRNRISGQRHLTRRQLARLIGNWSWWRWRRVSIDAVERVVRLRGLLLRVVVMLRRQLRLGWWALTAVRDRRKRWPAAERGARRIREGRQSILSWRER